MCMVGLKVTRTQKLENALSPSLSYTTWIEELKTGRNPQKVQVYARGFAQWRIASMVASALLKLLYIPVLLSLEFSLHARFLL